MKSSLVMLPIALGILGGLIALGTGLYLSARKVARAREEARERLAEADRDVESKQREILVAAQERALTLEEEDDRREREAEERETQIENRGRKIERTASELGRERRELERRGIEVETLKASALKAGLKGPTNGPSLGERAAGD